jgi:hypothetical protein
LLGINDENVIYLAAVGTEIRLGEGAEAERINKFLDIIHYMRHTGSKLRYTFDFILSVTEY